MTPAQIQLVQVTWNSVEPISRQAAALFYARLFELDPSLRPLFKGDIEQQGEKLMQMLAVCVKNLDRLEQILPAVEALGRRHERYGVEDGHYDTVAEALLWTLGEGLGEQFTPEAEQAWTEAYVTLAGTMKAAAAQADPDAAASCSD